MGRIKLFALMVVAYALNPLQFAAENEQPDSYIPTAKFSDGTVAEAAYGQPAANAQEAKERDEAELDEGAEVFLGTNPEDQTVISERNQRTGDVTKFE